MRFHCLSISLILLLSQPCHSIYAQSIRDTLQLPAAEISSSKFNEFSVGVKLTHIDSSVLSDLKTNNLSELLENQTSIFVKSNGPCYSGTSFRGATASQTGVYWNNMPLSSPMLGLVDFSLIPVLSANQIEIRHGGGSAAFGSGNTGGSIHLSNIPSFKLQHSVEIYQSAGSFQNYSSGLSFINSNSKMYSSTQVLYRQSENNFPYANLTDKNKTVQLLSNAAMNRYSVIQELHVVLNSDQTLSVSAWYQSGKREIPPGMSIPISKAFEDQATFRSSVVWKKTSGNSVSILQSGFIHDKLDYHDPLTGLNSNSYFNTSCTRAEFHYEFNRNFRFQTEGGFTYNNAFVNEYSRIRESRLAGFTAGIVAKNNSSKINSFLSLRKEFSNTNTIPWSPFAGTEILLVKHLSLKLNTGRNYRIPSLNDLYWIPGGNSNLKPETGWSNDAGLCYDFKTKSSNLTVKSEAGVFYSTINDMIIWLPSQKNASIWSPKNIRNVLCNGIEYSTSIAYHINHFKVLLNGSYTFTNSTNENTNDEMQGKQMIYVPFENAHIYLRTEYKSQGLSVGDTYTGGRYISADNEEALPAFQLINLMVWKSFKLKNLDIKCSATVNNMFDTAYQSIAWMPMPGRNYSITLQLKFQ